MSLDMDTQEKERLHTTPYNASKDISLSIHKVDSITKISGQEPYIADIDFPNVYFAKTFRASIVRGQILAINYPELPKDYYIVDAKDIPGKNYIKMIYEDFPVFASDQVTYYGEPISLVIGKDKNVIKHIIESIQVDYEVEEPVFNYINPVVSYTFRKGEVDHHSLKDLKFVEHTYNTGYQEHVYIEPQGMVGTFEEGKISLYGSIQCPYYVKNAVLQILNIEPEEQEANPLKVRVKQTTTGGAFGGKEEFPSLLACQLAVAVQKLHIPISLIYERTEDMEFSTKRHPSSITLQAWLTSEGDIKQVNADVKIDGGAYIGLSGVVLQRAMLAASGAYMFKNMKVSGNVYKTNTVPTGAFRGFGAPQMIFAVEMFMQHMANAIGIDPLKFRQMHLAKQGDTTSTNGKFRDVILMPEMIRKAMDSSNYVVKTERFREDLKEVTLTKRRDGFQQDEVYKGIGMSWFLHGCGFTGSGEQKHIKAVVKLYKSAMDTVTILIASVDMGQGVKTTMRKLVAYTLGIDIEQVILDNPDTDLVPDSGPTVASRTMMIVGGLLQEAAVSLKEEWVAGQEIVVEKHYKQPDYVQWDDEKLQGDAYPAYSWGVNVVEVEVSKVTYQVKLVGVWSIYDIGKAIDESIIVGQNEGGLLQGIAYGMLEVMNHKHGKIQQKTVTDYLIPTAKDSVRIETQLVDNPFALGPYGAKGAGELTLIGGAPAVALAIENAIGKKVTQIPVTPEYIMELMENE